MNFFYERGKIFVGAIQINARSRAFYILGRVAVMMLPKLHSVVAVVAYHGEMRVDIIVILHVVFMVGRGNEKGVEINGFHA